MTWRIEAVGGGQAWVLPRGRPTILGRAPECDLVVLDETISRRHAQLTSYEAGVEVRDLGSSNGTLLNGAAIEVALAGDGDTLTFGGAAFALRAPVSPAGPTPAGEMVRHVPLGEAEVAMASAGEGERLAALLDVARRLAGEPDLGALLDTIVRAALDLLGADRVALLLAEEKRGELIPAAARSRTGPPGEVRVPRSITRAAIEGREALQTDNAPADPRFRGASVKLLNVRSALAAPLLGDTAPLGVLYADLLGDRSFTEEDLRLLAAFAGLAAAALRNAQAQQALRREALLRSNLERFVAPDVAAAIARAPGGLVPGGVRRHVVVLFCDIRGFTQLAETMPPDSLAALLSEYCSELAEVVFEHGGTLDKFIGDAVLALWGAPEPQADAADRALAAARAMRAAVAALDQRWRATGRPAIEVGIGINAGEAFTGVIGSPRRLEYTAVGDVVNVAARLCDVAGPGEILVSGSFLMALAVQRPSVEPRPGVAEGREVYALVG
ncbi:MAG TPA: adenylate/guanylate cyclase domain-containing protein [Gemmatimonadales bacterium]|nr:adenylate/guanylate cyclase domain-containing protein [Gemmatimonadales bacterium]